MKVRLCIACASGYCPSLPLRASMQFLPASGSSHPPTATPMSTLHASMVGFDFTPPIHPEHGAWGTTPVMTEVDQPLLGRCLALRQSSGQALRQSDRLLLWFGLDLCGNSVAEVDTIRAELAGALQLAPQQIIWSTSQTHSSPTLPGSDMPGGSSITVRGAFDEAFCRRERETFIGRCIAAAREAMETLQPVNVRAGRGFCDSISYNRRFPLPNGRVKFSRQDGEGLQSGKFYDPTIGLVLFEHANGRPLGAIFNFCAHPATMVNAKWVSPDWVGSARGEIETALDGAPAMFVQGLCGDVNCHHIFGMPAQARATGMRLGRAAVAALPTLAPVRATPLDTAFRTIELLCRPMYTRDEAAAELAERQSFVAELEIDPAATWFAGVNVPEQFAPDEKAAMVQVQIDYLQEVMRMLDAGESAPSTLDFTVGAVRIGDVAAAIVHGENFTAAGRTIRQRSPFAHTLVCGDTNGLFGYVGDDAEVDRGGYETDSFWKMLYFGGVRLAPAKGSANRVIDTAVELLWELRDGDGTSSNS